MKGLYLVTPDWDDTHKLLNVSEAGLRGGAALLHPRSAASRLQISGGG